MSDQPEDNKPRLIPPSSSREILLTETFDLPADPQVDELIRLAARMANFLNLLVGKALSTRVVSAASPMPMAMLNASATLEGGALQQRQYMAQMTAMQGGGFVGPGGPGQGGPPPGMPPFRMN